MDAQKIQIVAFSDQDSSRSELLCTNAPRAHIAPQVTHDRPQIFPLSDRFLPLFEVETLRVNRC